MQTRYAKELHTPGDKPPEVERITHDQNVEDRYFAMSSRRRELSLQLSQGNNEQDRITDGLGEQVASGAEYKKQIARLAALRSEAEALEAGIHFLDGQCGMMRRMNSWLKL